MIWFHDIQRTLQKIREDIDQLPLNWSPRDFDFNTIEVPTIRPTIHEAMDAMACVRQLMLKGAHICGLGKIIMPDGYKARKRPYELTHADPRVKKMFIVLTRRVLCVPLVALIKMFNGFLKINKKILNLKVLFTRKISNKIHAIIYKKNLKST